MSAKTHFTYESAVNIFCGFLWVVRCILDIIVYNYTCEGVCTEVKFGDSLEKLMNNAVNLL